MNGTDGLAPAAEVVERALEASQGEGCVVIVAESSGADVRFANNATTTNGRRRDRRVTVVSTRAVDGGLAVGVARRGGDVDVEALVATAETDALSSPPADDASTLSTPTPTSRLAPTPTSPTPPPRPTCRSWGASFPGSPAPSSGPERPTGCWPALPSICSRPPTSAPRPDCVVATSSRRGPCTWPVGAPTGPVRPGPGRGPPTSPTSPWRPWRPRWPEVSVGRRTPSRPAGGTLRDRPCQPPWPTSPSCSTDRPAETTRKAWTVFSAPEGRTRQGEVLSALPFELRSDPTEPGLECMPFVCTPVSWSDASVFDEGLPSLGPPG